MATLGNYSNSSGSYQRIIHNDYYLTIDLNTDYTKNLYIKKKGQSSYTETMNNKELNPLKKVKRTLERDKLKLRRKEAIVAKKKIDLYGVNNYVDLDKDKAEKLKQELELFEGLKLSVRHCEEVMSVNVDRYPILVHTDKILRENIENIESDIKGLNKELMALREKNGTNND
jgi:hypothetical protein